MDGAIRGKGASGVGGEGGSWLGGPRVSGCLVAKGVDQWKRERALANGASGRGDPGMMVMGRNRIHGRYNVEGFGIDEGRKGGRVWEGQKWRLQVYKRQTRAAVGVVGEARRCVEEEG